MRTPLRLLLIVLLAPALAHVTAAVVLFAPLLVFTAPVSYPLSVAVIGVALPSIHAVFLRRTQDAAPQLRIVLVAGSIIGLVVYLLLSWSLALSPLLAAWYSGFGLINGVWCWALYNWGPLRVRRASPREQGSIS